MQNEKDYNFAIFFFENLPNIINYLCIPVASLCSYLYWFIQTFDRENKCVKKMSLTLKMSHIVTRLTMMIMIFLHAINTFLRQVGRYVYVQCIASGKQQFNRIFPILLVCRISFLINIYNLLWPFIFS